MSEPAAPSTPYMGLLPFLLASVDEVELSQVDTGKGLVLDATVLQFLLGQSQMEDLQSVLHLHNPF